jgi:hypothetical protein
MEWIPSDGGWYWRGLEVEARSTQGITLSFFYLPFLLPLPF